MWDWIPKYKSKFEVNGKGALTVRSLHHINNSSQISRSERPRTIEFVFIEVGTKPAVTYCNLLPGAIHHSCVPNQDFSEQDRMWNGSE